MRVTPPRHCLVTPYREESAREHFEILKNCSARIFSSSRRCGMQALATHDGRVHSTIPSSEQCSEFLRRRWTSSRVMAQITYAQKNGIHFVWHQVCTLLNQRCRILSFGVTFCSLVLLSMPWCPIQSSLSFSRIHSYSDVEMGTVLHASMYISLAGQLRAGFVCYRINEKILDSISGDHYFFRIFVFGNFTIQTTLEIGEIMWICTCLIKKSAVLRNYEAI